VAGADAEVLISDMVEGLHMLTTISFVMLALIAWIAHSGTKRDRRFYDLGSDENIREVTLHIQQDLKLVAFLLAGILVMLGILGDILSRH
jgi:ribose/xylose/arabinose/galactoside ABC-type transport system permease subunit